jgi:uncharacterized protein (TIGR04141 family)
MESIRLAVYRGKKATGEVSDLVNDAALGAPLSATIDGIVCKLWVTTHTGGRPSWVDTFATLFGVDPSQLLPNPPRSVSGLAWLTGNHGDFAVTFGHAWQKVKRESADPSFGIRCVLNLCDHDSLRAIKRDRMTTEFVQVMEQSPENTGINRFGIDTEADMLKGVKASVDPVHGFGTAVSGTDSFHCAWDASTLTLENFLREIVTLGASTKYKKRFDWIDFITPIREPTEIVPLDHAAVGAINQANSTFRLHPPGFSQWDDYDHFVFGRLTKSPVKDQLTLPSWKHYFQGKVATTSNQPVLVSDLKEQWIHAIDEAYPSRSVRWRVYDCIYGTIQLPSGTFMLHESNWYRLAVDYVARVDAALAKAPSLTGGSKLPLCHSNEHEADYNRRVARSSKRSIQLFDRKIIPHGGPTSKFEFCDLLGDNMTIYCVKRWASSAGISHLARQAVNTCKLLRGDEDFVRKVDGRLKGNHRANWTRVKNRSTKATVALVIMGCKSVKDLPFFSRMTLSDAIRQIQTLGFDVAFDWV